MDKQEFKDWCAKMRVGPERRLSGDEGVVYLGDSRVLCPPCSEYPRSHFRTIWALIKGDFDSEEGPAVKFGRTLYFDANQTDKEARLQAALRDAQDHMYPAECPEGAVH